MNPSCSSDALLQANQRNTDIERDFEAAFFTIIAIELARQIEEIAMLVDIPSFNDDMFDF